jgi:cytochrome c
MKRIHITALLISPLMLLLYACQPDTPAQHAGSSTSSSVPPAASQVAVATPAAAQPVPNPADAMKPVSKPGVGLSDAEDRALAQKSGCFTCHTIEKKLVGPAWNDVATKYHGQKDAEATLVAKVTKGGSGVWGTVPMPPNTPRVNENDIKTLVHFILSLK